MLTTVLPKLIELEPTVMTSLIALLAKTCARSEQLDYRAKRDAHLLDHGSPGRRR